MSQKEEFHFFYSGPFSQWHKSEFVFRDIKFQHCEAAMMWCKAKLFNDEESQKLIERGKEINHNGQKSYTPHSPSEVKAIGRNVKNFKDNVWRRYRKSIITNINRAKFTQNPNLLKIMADSRGKTLVEASPKDRIYGIGLRENDPRAQNRKTWLGENLLGEYLTLLRNDLEKEGLFDKIPKTIEKTEKPHEKNTQRNISIADLF